MPVTNKQMLEKWNDMPEDTRSQTVTAMHVAVVEGALDKGTAVRQAIDIQRKSGIDLSEQVLLLVHRDERAVLTKMMKGEKVGSRQQFAAKLIPRERIGTSGIPKDYRPRFEFVKETPHDKPTPSTLYAIVVASQNATVHVVDVAADEALLEKKTIESGKAIEQAFGVLESIRASRSESETPEEKLEITARVARIEAAIADAEEMVRLQRHGMTDAIRGLEAALRVDPKPEVVPELPVTDEAPAGAP